MKTILIEPNRAARFTAEVAGAGEFGYRGTGTHSIPAWLPAPAIGRPQKSAQKRPARSLWIRPSGETRGEKVLLALLVLSAAIAIGYGFNSLLELVQNWAGFNASIGQLIH